VIFQSVGLHTKHQGEMHGTNGTLSIFIGEREFDGLLRQSRKRLDFTNEKSPGLLTGALLS